MDSGASKTVLGRTDFLNICKRTGRTPFLSNTVELCGVTGHDIKVLGATQLQEKAFGTLDIIIVDNIAQQCIIGRDVFCSRNAQIDYDHGRLIWDDQSLVMYPTYSGSIFSLGDRPPIITDSVI